MATTTRIFKIALVCEPDFANAVQAADNKNDQIRFGIARTYKAPDGAFAARRSYSISNTANQSRQHRQPHN